MTEIWKPIPNYEGYYEVSNTGKVRSLSRNKVCGYGHQSRMSGRELKPTTCGNGYYQVCLSVNGKAEHHMIHRLVATVFVKNDDTKNKVTVNHIDCNKKNNNSNNLEWVSYSDNLKHAYNNGLNKWNPRKGKPSIPVVQLDIQTNELIAFHPSIGEAARKVGAKSATSIKRCCNNEKHYHSANGYKWMFEKDYKKILESEE